MELKEIGKPAKVAFYTYVGDRQSCGNIRVVIADLPPNLVPHLKLGFFHFMFFNVSKLPVLEGGYSMNCAA